MAAILEKVYINASRSDADNTIFSVNLETLIIINIYKISNPKNVRLCIKLHDHLPPNTTVNVDLSRIDYEIITTSPNIVKNLSWPMIVVNDNYAIAGLCSVARQLIKCTDNKKVRKLLGFREACLMACSESSIWTKFCEVDMIQTIKQLLIRPRIIHDNKLKLPKDFARFEYHLTQPVRMHNIYKIAREQNQDKDITNQIPINQLNLNHTYSEGPFMTLSDVILFPCIKVFFDLYNFNKLKETLPLLSQWYKTMNDMSFFQIKFEINRENYDYDSIIMPEFEKQSLYTADPNRYKPEKRIFTKQNDIVNSLKIIGSIDISNPLYPYGDDLPFDWSIIPKDVNPMNCGALPEKRAYRKLQQLENLAKAVMKMADNEQNRIVDFCSGSGHLGILLAYLLPNCKIILIENKELSLARAKERIDNLNLKNIIMLQSNLDYFIGEFDIGVSLHACGVATDLVIQNCILKKANFVCCPCCYGAIHDCYHISYPRSLEYQGLNMTTKDYMTLAHAADQTHEPNNWKTTQGFVCMDAIDTDRKLHAEIHGYEVHLGKLQPFSCTNKNNLLVGIYRQETYQKG